MVLPPFQNKSYDLEIFVGLKVNFCTFSTELRVLHSSHQVFSGEPGVSIVKLKTYDTNFIGSPPFWADGIKVHKIMLMCVDAAESKYQLLNKCKLLFDLVVHQQQHLHRFWQHSSSFGKV